jgi:predicted restriction endonuclease
LTLGHVYTRAQLKEKFYIKDATLNTGVFQPKGTSSVWLFITEKKSSDRTPYMDLLDNNLLKWQGQTKGRTNHLIIQHQQKDMEVLVFYRRHKYEYSGAAFKYEGCFNYQSHSQEYPASFILKRISIIDKIAAIQTQVEGKGDFDLSNIRDGEDKVLASIVRRRGQRAFRSLLIEAYSGRCAVTGCTFQDVLEAAHIVPYRGVATNHVQNGLLLRSDIHTLFDLHLLTVDQNDFRILITPQLANSEYAKFAGQLLFLPNISSQQPSRDALLLHKKQCIF